MVAEITVNASENEGKEEDPYSITRSELIENIYSIPGLDSSDKVQLEELVWSYRDVFSKKPGRIKTFEYDLRLKDNSEFFHRAYPVPKKYEELVDIEIQRMLQLGVIERSRTTYINPLVCVIKKDNSIRLCLDAR